MGHQTALLLPGVEQLGRDLVTALARCVGGKYEPHYVVGVTLGKGRAGNGVNHVKWGRHQWGDITTRLRREQEGGKRMDMGHGSISDLVVAGDARRRTPLRRKLAIRKCPAKPFWLVASSRAYLNSTTDVPMPIVGIRAPGLGRHP